MTTTTTHPAPTADAWLRALARARTAKLVAYRLDADTYEVPSVSQPDQSHLVRRTGPRPADWHCECRSGRAAAVCQHMAVAAYAAKHGVHAVRPGVSDQRAAVAEAERILAGCFAACGDCGARYAYVDGSLLERLYCPACRAAHPVLAGYR